MALRLNTPERLKLSWSQKKNILRKALLIKIFWATWLKFQPPKVKKTTKINKATGLMVDSSPIADKKDYECLICMTIPKGPVRHKVCNAIFCA